VFGSKQLNELVTPIQKPGQIHVHKNRHKVDLDALVASERCDGYQAFEAGVQL
jgi:hypothetical protein